MLHIVLRRGLSLAIPLILLSLLNGCATQYKDASRGATVDPSDLFGDNTNQVVYLPQGWDPATSEWFYNTTQGSNLMSYWLYKNLEDAESHADNIELFRSDENTRRFRYLPQSPTANNPDGLPVGFVKDTYKNKNYVGFTCAACHTSQVNYQGVGIRIDGGPAMADMVLFLTDLEKSLKSAMDDDAKFQRLVQRSGKPEAVVREQLHTDYTIIKNYNTLNHSEDSEGNDVDYGYARLDAFGRIFNRILDHLHKEPQLRINSPNAPVSIPFLWDTPYHDFVQWNGIGDNGSETLGLRLGPLGRNVGEVLGVFAQFSLEPGKNQYVSSANKLNLEELERSLQSLWSPSWDDAADANILPKINEALAEKGRKVYEEYQCQACHQGLGHEERKSIDRRITAQFTSLPYLGTDETMMMNAVSYCGTPGYFRDADAGMCGSDPKMVPAAGALSKAARSVIVKGDPEESLLRRAIGVIKLVTSSTKQNPIKETVRHVDLEPSNKSDLMGYKGRPLNGIWATAPYLHNGSVPNLYELFLPACEHLKNVSAKPGDNCRSTTFTVGSRELDPVKVGFVQKPKDQYPGLFEFDTTIPGNSNSGHEYAAGVTPMIQVENGKVQRDENGKIKTFWFKPITDEKRMALVEYLKTL